MTPRRRSIAPPPSRGASRSYPTFSAASRRAIMTPGSSRENEPAMRTSALVLAWVLTAAAARGAEYYHDFRTGEVGRPQLTIFGPDAEDYIHVGPHGLRIDLPAERDKYAPTGVETRFPFRGDFEVTVRYEVRGGDAPQKPYGSALNLYLRTSGDAWHDAILGRA